MPSKPFRSFQRTPVFFLTVGTHGHLPFLANDDAHAILRDAWLQLVRGSGWFVGQYLLMPSQVRLFATPAPRAWPLPAWMAGWRSQTKKRIASCSHWSGELWEPDFSHRFLGSVDDYLAKRAQLCEIPTQEGLVTKSQSWRYGGMIWELQESGREEVLPASNQFRCV